MRFGSTAKVLLKCKLKYYRISECVAQFEIEVSSCQRFSRFSQAPGNYALNVKALSRAEATAACFVIHSSHAGR